MTVHVNTYMYIAHMLVCLGMWNYSLCVHVFVCLCITIHRVCVFVCKYFIVCVLHDCRCLRLCCLRETKKLWSRGRGESSTNKCECIVVGAYLFTPPITTSQFSVYNHHCSWSLSSNHTTEESIFVKYYALTILYI